MTLKKKVIFSCILIFMCLGIIELTSFAVVKILDIPTETKKDNIFHPLRHHAYRPNTQIRDTHGELFTDVNGYIKNGIEIENPDLIIIITGASSVGTQTPFTGADKTISSIIEKQLNKNFNIKIKVQSLSVTSYPSFNELMMIYEYLEDKKLKADIIVSVNGLYTIYDFVHNVDNYKKTKKLYSLYDKNAVQRLVQYMDNDFEILPRVIYRTLSNLKINTVILAKHVIERLLSKKSLASSNEMDNSKKWTGLKEDKSVHDLYDELVRRESMNYNLMNSIAQAHDAKFISFLLPAAYTWKNWPKENMKEENIAKAYFQSQFYEAIMKQTRNIEIFDLSFLFDNVTFNDYPYSPNDTVHYNDIGTQMIANEIYKKLIPFIEELKIGDNSVH